MRPTIPVFVALAAAGCVDRPVSEVVPHSTHVEPFDVPTSAERDLDILFVIDSSQSMTEEHTALRASFGSLLDALDDAPGGLPNVHIGVVSSDLGTAPHAVDGRCDSTGGDRGLMLTAAGCPALGGNLFLEDVLDPDGTRRRNYSGTLGDAFACLANVGSNGCGFEQHLEAMKVALTPGTNRDFVRDHAALAVIFVADEDDCSSPNGALYDPGATATLGAMTDFRCHAHGIVCTDNPDPAALGPRTGCAPDPESDLLQNVDRYVEFLVGLKGGRRDKVIVGGIIGDPSQVEIGLDSLDRPEVRAACPSGGLGSSEPGLRFAAFFDGFQHSSYASLCDGDLSGALDQIGEVITAAGDLRYCVSRPLADRNPQLGGLQPECSLTEVDGTVETIIPLCNDTSGRPCWRVIDDAACASGQGLEVDRGGASGPEDGVIHVQCVVTDPDE